MLRGLNYFREVIGQDPRLHANHTGQVESIYWGRRGSTACRRSSTSGPGGSPRARINSTGIAGSPYFWGDLCRDRITYVRNLVFPEINTLKVDPLMPYHDRWRPYVRYWFSSSEAPRSIPSASSSQFLFRRNLANRLRHMSLVTFYSEVRLAERLLKVERLSGILRG